MAKKKKKAVKRTTKKKAVKRKAAPKKKAAKKTRKKAVKKKKAKKALPPDVAAQAASMRAQSVAEMKRKWTGDHPVADLNDDEIKKLAQETYDRGIELEEVLSGDNFKVAANAIARMNWTPSTEPELDEPEDLGDLDGPDEFDHDPDSQFADEPDDDDEDFDDGEEGYF